MSVMPGRRTWRRVWIAVVVLFVVGTVAGMRALLTGGPAPRLEEVRTEPILVAPVPAVELGRREQQSQWGLGLPDSYAVVQVAYQVAGPADDAVSAWTAAYGREYGLEEWSSHDPITLVGFTDDLSVTVYVGAEVKVPESDSSDYAAPAPGSTVVTVVVSAG